MTAFVLALGAFLAGVMKVGFGQGSGMLPLPLYTLVVPARFANGVLAPLLLLGDLVSIRAYWRKWETRLLAIFLPGQVVGVVIGAQALAHLSEQGARRAIGTALVVVVCAQVWARRNPKPAVSRGTLGGGFVASLLAGLTSSLAQLGSVFLSVYLIRLRMDKSALVPTMNITFFFTNLVKIGLYWRYGLINQATWIADAWLAPAALLGGLAGVAAHRRISARAFENGMLAFATAAGLKLLLW